MSNTDSALSTVESALRDYTEVAEVVEFHTTSREPAARVVAVRPQGYASAIDLRDHLWASLDPADLPDVIAVVDVVPRDATGQVDTTRLEKETAVGGCTFSDPSTDAERAVAAIWREVLGRARVSADDNFLDLGGDSMTATVLLDLTNDRLGTRLSLLDVLDAPSLRALAAAVDNR
jgi:myxalamid-type nonribosomal peptide synthetase MxaA